MATDAKTGQPIFGNYSVGLNNVGSYQSSGWPWITGSALPGPDGEPEKKISFPRVTKSITVIQSGSLPIRAHFAATASGDVVAGHHYISTNNDNDSITFNVKCKEMWISAPQGASGYEVFAELTQIPTGSMFILTGSGHTTP
jgi:hypothetical protein